MFTVGMKITLWKWYTETFQVVVNSQHTLTVTEASQEDGYKGILEDGSKYTLENGYWWANTAEGEFMFDMAVHVWNRKVSNSKGPIRILSSHDGTPLVPGGDSSKCEKHNRYFFTGDSCFSCRNEALKAI